MLLLLAPNQSLLQAGKSRHHCCSSLHVVHVRWYSVWSYCGVFQMILSIVMGLGGLAIGTIYAYPAVALARWEDADFKLTTTQSTWFGELRI